MKKALLVISTSLFLSACSSGQNISETEDTYFIPVDSLPYPIQINAETFSLEDVSIYRNTDESGFEYSPYVSVRFDISNMSEQELHWMIEDDCLDISCYFTSEQNKVDFESIPHIKSYYTDSEYISLFGKYSTSYRYDLSDIELSVSVRVKQETEHPYVDSEGETSMLNDWKYYSISFNDTYGLENPIKDISEMPDKEYEMLIEGMYDIADFYKELSEY